MNTSYLDIMKEIRNKYKASLNEGEKVVFTAKLWGMHSDDDVLLGADTLFTMTNRRIIADNGGGAWTADISDDVTDMYYGTIGKFLTKEEFIQVDLNKEITYGMGIQKLHGFRFHFKKGDRNKMLEIIDHMKL